MPLNDSSVKKDKRHPKAAQPVYDAQAVVIKSKSSGGDRKKAQHKKDKRKDTDTDQWPNSPTEPLCADNTAADTRRTESGEHGGQDDSAVPNIQVVQRFSTGDQQNVNKSTDRPSPVAISSTACVPAAAVLPTHAHTTVDTAHTHNTPIASNIVSPAAPDAHFGQARLNKSEGQPFTTGPPVTSNDRPIITTTNMYSPGTVVVQPPLPFTPPVVAEVNISVECVHARADADEHLSHARAVKADTTCPAITVLSQHHVPAAIEGMTDTIRSSQLPLTALLQSYSRDPSPVDQSHMNRSSGMTVCTSGLLWHY
jgi:hypothetical protein